MIGDSRPGAGQETPATASPRLVLAILSGVVALNLFDRQLINILAQDIKTDLLLTDAELGLLTGTALGLFKALFSMPVSSWADRRGRPRVLAILVAMHSAFSILCGAASGFLGLAIARMGVGIGESAGVPVATAIARDHFPTRATTALAIAMAGNPLGTFLAFLVGGAIADRWGWRCSFVAGGAPGLLLAWILVRKIKEVRVGSSFATISGNWVGDALDLLRSSRFRPLIIATSGSMLIANAASAWMPAFFMRVHGLSTAQAGLFAAIAIGIGGALGTLSGLVCDLVRKHIIHSESVMMLLTTSASLPFLFVTVVTASPVRALVSFFIYNALAYAWLAPTIRLIQDAVEASSRAFAISLCSAVAVSVSLGVGVPFIGRISDLTSGTYGLRAIGYSLFAVTSIAVAITVFSHFLIWRQLRASDRR